MFCVNTLTLFHFMRIHSRCFLVSRIPSGETLPVSTADTVQQKTACLKLKKSMCFFIGNVLRSVCTLHGRPLSPQSLGKWKMSGIFDIPANDPDTMWNYCDCNQSYDECVPWSMAMNSEEEMPTNFAHSHLLFIAEIHCSYPNARCKNSKHLVYSGGAPLHGVLYWRCWQVIFMQVRVRSSSICPAICCTPSSLLERIPSDTGRDVGRTLEASSSHKAGHSPSHLFTVTQSPVLHSFSSETCGQATKRSNLSN